MIPIGSLSLKLSSERLFVKGSNSFFWRDLIGAMKSILLLKNFFPDILLALLLLLF